MSYQIMFHDGLVRWSGVGVGNVVNAGNRI